MYKKKSSEHPYSKLFFPIEYQLELLIKMHFLLYRPWKPMKMNDKINIPDFIKLILYGKHTEEPLVVAKCGI